MSVDFTLPKHPNLELGQTVYVPLMIIEKRDLRNLDVRDRVGHPLNVLTREQNSAVALAGIEAHLGSGEAATVARDQLAQIIDGDPRIAKPLAETIEIDEAKLLSLWSTKGLDLETVEFVSGSMKALLKNLAIGFLLLVPIPYRPDVRQLVKFSYDAEMKRPKLRRLLSWNSADTYRWTTRMLSSFGLAARQEEFNDLSPGWGESYHAEVVPPAATYAANTTLEIETAESEEPLECSDDNPWRPHVRAPQEGRPRSSSESGVVTTLIQARRDGLFFPLFLSAAVITGVLAYIPERVGELDGVTLGALLLAPFALALYYARSGENSYVTNAMRGVRFVGTLPVLAGVTAIALVALGYLGDDAAEKHDWAISTTIWAARISAGASVVLFMALLTPGLGWGARWVEKQLPKTKFSGSVQGATKVLGWLVVVFVLYRCLAWMLPI